MPNFKNPNEYPNDYHNGKRTTPPNFLYQDNPDQYGQNLSQVSQNNFSNYQNQSQNSYPNVPPNYQSIPQYNNPNNSNSYFQVGSANATETVEIKKENPVWVVFLLAKWWLILLVTVLITLSFVGVYVILNQKPEEPIGSFNNVSATISGPTTLAKGIPQNWKIVIENREDTAIQQVELRLQFDKSFEFIKAISPRPFTPRGDIYKIARLDAPGQGISQAIIEIQGTTKGDIDEEIILKGVVSYTPDKLVNLQNAGKLPAGQNVRKSISTTTARTLTTAPQITIEMMTDNQVVQNGGEVELNVFFTNTSEQELKDLKVRMNYPDRGAFVYTASELISSNTSPIKTIPDDGNNIWFIPSLQRLQKQTLKIRGNVSGANGVKLTFSADLGIRSGSDYSTITQRVKDITIASQPIIANTFIEGKSGASFRPGEVINVVISYENRGTVPLRNVEIFGFLDDPASVLDWSQAKFIGGDRGNLNNNVVQWRGSNVNQLINLGTRVKGQLRYSVKVKDDDKFLQPGRKQNDYTITPKVQVQADNLQQTEFSGDTYKAQGGLMFEQKITDRGPEPGQINKRRFNVIWTFKTLQNNVNEVTVNTRTALPPNAWVASSITPVALVPQLSYDSTSGQITWKPNKIPGYAGLSTPVVTIGFDLIVESQTTNFNGIELFETNRITGTDEYTGQRYDQNGPAGKAN